MNRCTLAWPFRRAVAGALPLAAVAGSGGVAGYGSPRGAHFASVAALRRLRRELSAHGAPRRLVDACSRAAHDEVRHAASFGAKVPRVVLAPATRRSLVALAIDNAREGCVRESFGALLATWQAEVAADAEVRALMATVAADETRHADLAWYIDAWLRTRLDADERAVVEAARAAELTALAADLTAPAALALHRAFTGEVTRRRARA